MTKQEYRPRADRLMVEWAAPAEEFDMDETMDFETESGMASISRRAFEFFFAPIASTTAEVGGSIG